MASGNRVDRLEEQVERLEATVQGLSEQLVEANDRICRLEKALSGDVEAAAAACDEGEASFDPDADLFDDQPDWSPEEGVDDGGARPVKSEDSDGYERQFEVEDADPEEVEAAAGRVETAAGAIDGDGGADGGGPDDDGDDRIGNTSKSGEDDSGDEEDTDDIIVA